MTAFTKGTEYKLYRQSGDLAERTARCTGINRELGKIRFDIIGSELEGFSKMKTVILNLRSNGENEIAGDMSFKHYLSIISKDQK